MSVEEPQLGALRAQLGALAYDAAGLSAGAAPLVAALLRDLLAATTGLRDAKEGSGDATQAKYQVRRRLGGRLEYPAPSRCSCAYGASTRPPSAWRCRRLLHILPRSPIPTNTWRRLQVEVLRREVGRLSGENARLHQDLMREADARGAGAAEAAAAARAAQAAAAQAALGRQQALERAAALEKERDGLRTKLRDLLAMGMRHPGGGCWPGAGLPGAGRASQVLAPPGRRTRGCSGLLQGAPLHALTHHPMPTVCDCHPLLCADQLQAALQPRMTATAPLVPQPAPAAQARTSRGAISLIKAADARILSLEAEARRREAEAAGLATRLQQAQVRRGDAGTRAG